MQSLVILASLLSLSFAVPQYVGHASYGAPAVIHHPVAPIPIEAINLPLAPEVVETPRLLQLFPVQQQRLVALPPPLPVPAPVAVAPLPFAAPAPVILPAALAEESSQFHAQDELGGFSFGYANADSVRQEKRLPDGTTVGFYSYIDANNVVQRVDYAADPIHGFRVIGTNIPVANNVALSRKRRSYAPEPVVLPPAPVVVRTFVHAQPAPLISLPAPVAPFVATPFALPPPQVVPVLSAAPFSPLP